MFSQRGGAGRGRAVADDLHIELGAEATRQLVGRQAGEAGDEAVGRAG